MNMAHHQCRSKNSVECAALKLRLPFYQAMGQGYDCSCICHALHQSNEQTALNFQRFMREANAAGVLPTFLGEDSSRLRCHDPALCEVHLVERLNGEAFSLVVHCIYEMHSNGSLAGFIEDVEEGTRPTVTRAPIWDKWYEQR